MYVCTQVNERVVYDRDIPTVSSRLKIQYKFNLLLFGGNSRGFSKKEHLIKTYSTKLVYGHLFFQCQTTIVSCFWVGYSFLSAVSEWALPSSLKDLLHFSTFKHFFLLVTYPKNNVDKQLISTRLSIIPSTMKPWSRFIPKSAGTFLQYKNSQRKPTWIGL